MKLNWDCVNITPTLPVRLSGFGKVRWAEEIHDALYARLFLFQDEQCETLLVQMDLVAVDEALVELFANQCGLDQDHVVLMATHTHSGPVGTVHTDKGHLSGLDLIFGEYNEEYCQQIVDKCAASCKKMRENMQSFQYRLLKGKVHDLGSDRHDPALPCDEDMILLDLKREDGKKALLARMACHPTVMNQDNLKITADFPGAIEPLFSEYDQVAYVNGSCGNMSTRFTRKGNGFEEVERFGQLAADQMKELLASNEPFQDDFTLITKRKRINLMPRKMDSIEEASKKLDVAKVKLEEGKKNNVDHQALRVLESVVEGAQNNLLACQSLSTLESLCVSVSWLKLPKLNFITVPCELFSELSARIKDEVNAIVIGYTNGYYLYLPDEESFRKQVYESFSSPFEAGEGEALMDVIAQWLKEEGC